MQKEDMYPLKIFKILVKKYPKKQGIPCKKLHRFRQPTLRAGPE